MIRPAGLALMVLAALAAGLVFHVSREVEGLEARLSAANDRLTADREAIRILHSEWAYLSRIDRIEELTHRHLPLGPVRPEQLVSGQALVQLPMRPEEIIGAEIPDVATEPVAPGRFNVALARPVDKPVAPASAVITVIASTAPQSAPTSLPAAPAVPAADRAAMNDLVSRLLQPAAAEGATQ